MLIFQQGWALLMTALRQLTDAGVSPATKTVLLDALQPLVHSHSDSHTPHTNGSAPHEHKLLGITDLRAMRTGANMFVDLTAHVPPRLNVEETTALEQQITKLAGEVQVLAGRQAQARTLRESVAEEVAVLLREKERQTARIARLEAEIDELQSELSGLDAKIDGFKAELASPMAQNLTAEEEDLIETLGRDVEQRQKNLVDVGKEKNELGGRKNLLEIELNEGLVRRREELRLKIEGLGAAEAGDTDSQEALETKTRELKALNNSIDSLEKRITGEWNFGLRIIHRLTCCHQRWKEILRRLIPSCKVSGKS